MKNISVRFGLIASAAFILWVCIEHALGYNTTKMEIGQYTRLESAYLFWLLIIITLIARKKQPGGVITFPECFKTGIIMVIIYSTVTAVWLAIYQHFINPEFYPLVRPFSIDQMKAAGKSEADIASTLKKLT